MHCIATNIWYKHKQNLPAPVTITFFETCPGRLYNWVCCRAVPVLLEMPMKLLRHPNPSTNCSDRKDKTARDTIHAADIHTLLLLPIGEFIDNILLIN